MPRFFMGETDGKTARIFGEDARHIALSLRMKPGEQVTLCDPAGLDHHCVIIQVSPEQVLLQVAETCPCGGEPSVQVTLYQALPKGDKMETIVQKAVELGVWKIVPVLSGRCISRPDGKAMAKKRERYQRIALEAAKQCGRGRVPVIAPLMDFEEAARSLAQAKTPLFFYENADLSLKSVLHGQKLKEVAVLIGSEGGFESSEAQMAASLGLKCVSLGKRILRCETAPLAALAAVMYEAGEM